MSIHQHSPLSCVHSHQCRERVKVWCWQSLCEHVGSIPVHGAVLKGDAMALSHISNEVVSNVDVFGALVVLIILRDHDGQLIVAAEGVGCLSGHAILCNEHPDPQSSFCHVSHCNILSFGC